MREEPRLDYCDICGNGIYPDEPHYEMPDGFLVCEDSECVEAWLSRYKTTGASEAADMI